MSAPPHAEPGFMDDDDRPRSGEQGATRLLVMLSLIVGAAVIGSVILLEDGSRQTARDASTAGAEIGSMRLIGAGAGDSSDPSRATPLPTALDAAAHGTDASGDGLGTPAVSPRALLSRLHGHVTDDTGATLTDVPVSLRSEPPRGTKAARRPSLRQTTADEDGRFEFAAVAPGTWRLSARAEGHHQGVLDVELTSGEQLPGLRLVLSRACRLAGVVYDAQGLQAAGREVHARLLDDRDGMRAKTHTDAEGHFQLTRLRPGPHVLSFRIDGMDVPALPADLQLELPLARDQRVELRIPAPGMLTGRALSQGRPIPDCDVCFQSDVGSAYGRTDEHGLYELSVPRACSGRILAVRRQVAMTPWVPVEIVPGLTKTLDLRFGSQRLHGRVLDTLSGEPVPNTEVRFDVLSDGEPGAESFTRRTDKEGRFAANNVYPASWRLLPNHRKYLAAEATDVVLSADDAPEIILAMTPGATLRGVIFDTDCERVATSLRLHLLPHGQDVPSPFGHLVHHQPFKLLALPGGHYDLFAVPVKHRHVDARRADLERLAVARNEVHLVEGQTLRVTLQVEPEEVWPPPVGLEPRPPDKR